MFQYGKWTFLFAELKQHQSGERTFETLLGMEYKAISTAQKKKDLLGTPPALGSHGRQPRSGSVEGLASAPRSYTCFSKFIKKQSENSEQRLWVCSTN